MLLQEFLDLGFKITFEQPTTNYTMVTKEDKRYVEIFNAYANHDELLGDKLLRQYKIDCRSRTSQGTDDGNMMDRVQLHFSILASSTKVLSIDLTFFRRSSDQSWPPRTSAWLPAASFP